MLGLNRCRIPALHSASFLYLPLMRQIVISLIMAIIFLVGVRVGVKWADMKNKPGPREENTTTVVQQIQSLADLITVKYVEEKVVILHDERWYGESHVLLLAHGIVKAGIDLKKLSPGDVSISGKTITLRLPDPQITDAYLDDRETRVIDHTTGLFRQFDKDLEQTARKTAVADLRFAARQAGIINDADVRAKMELAVFLHQAGYERIAFAGKSVLPLENPLH
jgi:hypothetical protein